MSVDIILGPLVDVTISKVISVTAEQLNLAVGFKQELKRFRVVLSMVKGVLQDAEQKKVTGHFDLQPWLMELGNIVDEADNVVDEIAYEHLRYKVAHKKRWKKVGYFFTLSSPLAFRLKIANRIKDLNLDLASLNDWATGLGLQYRLANKLLEHIEIQQTDSSLGDPSKILGREKKALEVIKSLIDSSNDQPVCVVSIVGMGGIGKTTMAKLVCNNEQIQRHFFEVNWVCVSENFDVEQISKEMLKTISPKDGNRVDLLSQDCVVKNLREKLEEKAKKGKLERQNSELEAKQEKLEQKNYLLVLDDVWNEDGQKWENLRSCLLGIGKNVRVLVTTRSQNVATIMGTRSEHNHHLEKLIDDDCWSIIKQRAFGNSSCPTELEGIGMDIAKKCRGVALVANVIGGIVFNNRKKDDWLSIKDNREVWGSIEEANGVMRVLQLSFHRLPTSALKQCFAFCSIFPKNFVMEKEMLIQLWMAEGFLQPSFSERYLEMEDIGDKYFNALLSHSLFEVAERDSYGCIIACKMHDLIHDLAKFVSKSQTLISEDGSDSNIPIDIRHLHLISDEGMTTAKLGDAMKKLHTLFSRVDVFHNMHADLRKVQVLSFCGANIDELPAFWGKLKRLRYLDVSKARIEELPKFITKLYHLQTFRFMDCYNLKRPLQGIWDLVSLRHIYFNDEKHMPAGIGRLACLKTLQLFVVGGQKGHRIEELACLSQLRGKLEIRNLDMVRNKAEAKGARLSEKAEIQELELVFGSESNASEYGCKHEEDVLEGLQPHSNLKGLTIKYYYGETCPSWMLERVNFLTNLVSMKFYECPWLKSIPSLLHSNEANVEIKNCKNLISIANSSLQKLIIEECDQLVTVEVGPLAMKSLKEVHIERCGKLQILPMLGELQSLEILELEECRSLRMIGDSAEFASTCLKELNISGCQSLMSMPAVNGLSSLQKINISSSGGLESIGESLSSSTCLKEFTVWDCGDLTSLPSLHGLSSLQKIHISHCQELKSIGESLSSLPCLEELTIFDCDGLKSLPSLHGLSSLQTLRIENCFGLTSLPSGLPSCTFLEKLTIARCYNLISIPDDIRSTRNSPFLAHLKMLEIGGFSTKLKGFLDLSFIRGSLVTLIAWGKPRARLLDQIQHQTTLRELTIKDFDGMEALPNWFGNLSTLQTLSISRCKSLKHMEAIQCLSKLNSLQILDCPELEERCARGSGSEWDYISHIPNIKIDYKRIQSDGAPVEQH